jgi:hypothetical protein
MALCFIRHSIVRTYWGSGGIAPRILYVGGTRPEFILAVVTECRNVSWRLHIGFAMLLLGRERCLAFSSHQ